MCANAYNAMLQFAAAMSLAERRLRRTPAPIRTSQGGRNSPERRAGVGLRLRALNVGWLARARGSLVAFIS